MSPIASTHKSTNVRITEPAAARSLALAGALWAGAVGLGALDGVFVRLGTALDLALALFAAAFAAATYALDGSVRGAVDRVPLAGLAAIAFGGDATAAWEIAQGLGGPIQGASALLALFVVPLGLAAHVPAARAARRRFRRAPARSPGASPAAT